MNQFCDVLSDHKENKAPITGPKMNPSENAIPTSAWNANFNF